MAPEIKYDDASPEAEGDWRVDHALCTACGAPPVQAPDLMGFGDKFVGASPGSVQCYFKKQPSSVAEVDRACDAAKVSCCNAVRYFGCDQEIKRRIPELVGPAPEPSWLVRSSVRWPRTWGLVLAGVVIVGVVLAALLTGW